MDNLRDDPETTRVINPRIAIEEGHHIYIRVENDAFCIAVSDKEAKKAKDLEWVNLFTNDLFTEENIVPVVYFADDDADMIRVLPAPEE